MKSLVVPLASIRSIPSSLPLPLVPCLEDLPAASLPQGKALFRLKVFTFIESAIILAIVVLGGMGSQVGVVIASIVMIGGAELLRNMDSLKWLFGEDFDPSLYRMLLFGIAMVAVMVWKPRGIISTRMPTVFLKQKKAVSGDLVKEGAG